MSHILIAYEREPEPSALEQLLLARSHNVVRCSNGLEALDVARREPPDLIVSDVLLPRMDGIALCRKWKQDERLQSVPFIFHNRRYDDAKYERFAQELGAERFLTRAMSPQDALAAIEDAIAEARSRVVANTTASVPDQPDVSAMMRSQTLVQEQQLRSRLAELEATAQRHAAGEVQFRSLFEDNPLPLLILDQASDGFIAVNAAAMNFYGYGRLELLSLQLPALVAADSCAAANPVITVRKDGHRIAVNIISTDIQFQGRPARLLCVLDHSAYLQQLQSTEAQLNLQRNLLETLPAAWCLIDSVGHLLDANNAYCRLSGYERDELLRKSLSDLDSGDHGEECEYETQHRRRDGALYPVDVRVTALRDASGETSGARLLMIQEPSARALALLTAHHRSQREVAQYVQVCVTMLEQHEIHCQGSSRRVAQLAAALARAAGLTAAQCERVRIAALLHDIGLMSIPASLIGKPTEFTAAEFALVRTHAETGAMMLAKLPDSRTAEIVRQHHERVNGSGYPNGLRGEAIAIEARVLAIADVLEAMCSPRPHRPALGMNAALEEIETNSGVMYDARIAAACLRLLREQDFAFAA